MEGLNKELNSAMTPQTMFELHLFGFNIPVTDTVIVMWVIMAFLILFAYIFTRKFEMVPKGKQNLIETVVELLNNLFKDAIGHHWKSFAPYLGTVMLFLIFANTVAIFNIIPSGEDLYRLTHLEFFEHLPHFALWPPTRDINVTAAMAVISILVVLGAEIRFKGVGGWLKSFIDPLPVLAPFKLLEYGIRPMSLCLRLFGNILAAFIVMELAYFAFPGIIPAALSIYFDLFDGALQAFVFVFLTSLFIGEAVE